MFRSLRTEPLHEAIQHQLKQYILDHGLRPGDQLPTEEQISREIGASRNAVREALRSLESLGMIEVRRGDGRYVRNFNFDAVLDNLAYAVYFDQRSFMDLMEVRGEVEVAFISRAIPLLDDEDITELRRLVATMREKAAVGRLYREEDEQFHRRIFHKVGNQLVLQILDIFWRITTALQASNNFRSAGAKSASEVCDQHAQIVEALAHRDEAAARAAMRFHFDFYLANTQ